MNKINLNLFSDVFNKECQEMVNTICSNLIFADNLLKTIAVTSCNPGEGKTYMTLQLGRALTKANKRVVVIDSNFHHSETKTEYTGQLKVNSKSLVEYLTGKCEITDILYATNVYNLFFIPCPELTVNPSYLFDMPRYQELLNTLSGIFDIILINTPSAGVTVDTSKIARYCNGIVIVVAYNKTKRSDLKNTITQLNKTGCPILGCIINKVNFRSFISRKAYGKMRKAH